MKIQPIDWDCLKHGPDEECDDSCNNRAIKCPACGEPWLTDYDGEYEFQDNTECPHLKFVIFQEDEEIRFFNGFTEDQLFSCIEPAARKLDPNLHGLTVKEFFDGVTLHEAGEKVGLDFHKEWTDPETNKIHGLLHDSKRFNEELWSLVNDIRIDTILDHTDCGMACGPVSFTVFYGAQLENGDTTP